VVFNLVTDVAINLEIITVIRNKSSSGNRTGETIEKSQHCVPVFSTLGACSAPFGSQEKHGKNVAFHFTQHWLELANW